MKYTKKLILVPSERYAELQKCFLKSQQNDLSEVMETQTGKGVNDAKSSPTIRTTEVPPRITTPERSLEVKANNHAQDHSDVLKPEHIVAAMGKPYRSKTKNLLDYLNHADPNILKWTKKGELLHNGQIIPGSNVIDLFRSAMHGISNGLNIPGVNILENILHESNAPISLLGNKYWKDRLTNKKGHLPLTLKRVDNRKRVKTVAKGGVNKKFTKWISL